MFFKAELLEVDSLRVSFFNILFYSAFEYHLKKLKEVRGSADRSKVLNIIARWRLKFFEDEKVSRSVMNLRDSLIL